MAAIVSSSSSSTTTPAAPSTADARARPQHGASRPISLQQVLSPEAVLSTGVLRDPNGTPVDKDKMDSYRAESSTFTFQAELLPHLPPGQQSAEFLESTVRSPQLTQSITALDEALQGGNYGAVVSNFGIDPSPGTAALLRGDPVTAFVTSLVAEADRNRGGDTASPGESGGGEPGGQVADPSSSSSGTPGGGTEGGGGSSEGQQPMDEE
eukprot:gene2913-3565_t